MKSTIRVDFDFDTNETFIQLNVASVAVDIDDFRKKGIQVVNEGNLDLADKHLKSFIEQANNRGIELSYPNGNNDNSTPQIRLSKEKEVGYNVQENSDAFIKFLRDKNISYKANGGWTTVTSEYSAFKLGLEWCTFKLNNAPRD